MYTAHKIFLVFLLFLPVNLGAGVPGYMNFQGFLKDESGVNLSSGIYSLRFAIYEDGVPPETDPTEEIPIWGPQYFDDGSGPGHGAKVVVVNGHFNVILGPQDDGFHNEETPRELISAFDSESRFIEVSVCTEPVCDDDQDYIAILPRQQILSTPFALNSALLAGHAQNHFPPIGTIIAFAGADDAIPEGWLLCDGADVPAGAEYDELRALLPGNSTPDLRGKFLRGLNVESTGPDPDRVLLSEQDDLLESHSHSFKDQPYGSDYVGGGAAPGWRPNTDFFPNDSYDLEINDTGGIETRPLNVAVNYIIRH